MKTHPEPRILCVDRLRNSIIVGFDDGACVLYSAYVLRACVFLAEDVTNVPSPDEE